MEKIEYTDHAEENIKERKINKNTIKEVIHKADESVLGNKGRKIFHKFTNGKVLRIICEEDGKSYIVITAYYSKAKRYKK